MQRLRFAALPFKYSKSAEDGNPGFMRHHRLGGGMLAIHFLTNLKGDRETYRAYSAAMDARK
jgi:hypothetical protein